MHGNVMVAGITGSGKSSTVREMLKQDSSEVKIVLGKETKALARDMAKWSIESSSRCIYDSLDDQQRVFPLSVLPRGDNRELCIEGTLESLMRRRGSANADQNPLLETVTEHWMNLIYDLNVEVSDAMHLFRSGTKVRDVGLSSDFWNDIPGLAARERVLGPTERLTSILRKPCVESRWRSTTYCNGTCNRGDERLCISAFTSLEEVEHNKRRYCGIVLPFPVG